MTVRGHSWSSSHYINKQGGGWHCRCACACTHVYSLVCKQIYYLSILCEPAASHLPTPCLPDRRHQVDNVRFQHHEGTPLLEYLPTASSRCPFGHHLYWRSIHNLFFLFSFPHHYLYPHTPTAARSHICLLSMCVHDCICVLWSKGVRGVYVREVTPLLLP